MELLWQALAALLILASLFEVPRIAYAVASSGARRAYRACSGGRVDLTVVVPARLEPLTLIKGLVYNVAGQRCRPRELIIVWDYPGEGFERVAREAWRLGDRLGLEVRMVLKPWRGRGKASVLNYAARLARGRILLFIDVDDRLASPCALCEAYRAALEHGAAQLGVVGVAYLHRLQGPPAVAIHAGFKAVHVGRVRLGAQPLLVGSGLAVDRRLLLREPFDEEAIVEDVDLAVRLGARGVKPKVLPGLLAMAGAPGYRAFRRQQSRWSRGVGGVLRRRWRLLLGMGLRGLELGYLLASYALDAPAALIAALYAVLAALGAAPVWPLTVYALTLYAQTIAVTPLTMDAPVARRARNSAAAGAMAAVLQPVLLVNWLRGFAGREGVFEVTPRRISERERPGRLETIYALLAGAPGLLLLAKGFVVEGLALASYLAALAYLHVRLPMLSGRRRHPRGPSRRRA